MERIWLISWVSGPVERSPAKIFEIEVLRGDVEAGAFDGLAARNDHPFSFGVLLNREIVADLVLPGVGGGELARP